MTGFFDKLGLSPQERRLVVIVGIVVFVVFNIWWIIPKFGEYGRLQEKIRVVNGQLSKFNSEIQNEPRYVRELQKLKSQGSEIATEEAALRIQQEVMNQANLVGLTYNSIVPVNRGTTTTKTNAWFDEAAVNVSINTGEKELIDFLVRLADKDLLIRAKSMDIGPDPSQMRLQGNLTLVKSFQRKPPARSVAGSVARPSSSAPASSAPPAPAATAPPLPRATSTPAPATVPGPTPTTPTPVPRRPGVLATQAVPPSATSPSTNVIPRRTLPLPAKP